MQKIVLVTGASRGLGESIAKLFLKNDYIVYVNYNNTKKEIVEEKFKGYNNVRFVECDVSKEDEVVNMVNIIKKEFGYLNVVVNNASIAIDTELEDKTVDNFKKILDVNLIGTFLVSKYVKDIMENGSIINISSTNAIDTYYPFSMDYDASKAGVISLTKNFAELYAPNIRVNAIAPGWINTDMNKEMDNDFKKDEEKKILLNRFAEPEEIAEVVYFLASDKANYINGSVIRVDGGLK